MSLSVVTTNSFDYKRLKEQFPYSNTFYRRYYEGGYLNTAYVVFYDEDMKELFTDNLGYYG